MERRMEMRHREIDADARRIGGQVASELQLAFAEHGFWLETRGAAPMGGRAYVDIAPIRADLAVRIVERMKEWDAA
jgi:hypothetical protein